MRLVFSGKKLGISTAVGGCIYYNNITKGTWEYLVEPNEDARGEWTPWEFQCNVGKKSIMFNFLKETLKTIKRFHQFL